MEYFGDLQKIRQQKPLVHHITNYVVVNDNANITLALGASPIMAHAMDELEDLVSIASVLYLNIGTLDKYWIESMLTAGKLAEKYNVPVVLDPVGAGASTFRTKTVEIMLNSFKINVLKGNGGEMLSIAGIKGGIKGVDSIKEASIETANAISEKYNLTAVVTGKTDYISNGKKSATINNGTDMFQMITGSGCMAGSVIASFHAVNKDPFTASIESLVTFEIAGEMAIESSSGPGTFKEKLIDELFHFKKEYYDLAKVSIFESSP
jgi:hydroxyethylthiazole kinase